MIRPILCYGSEIWSAFDGNKKIFQNIDGIPKFLDSLDIENVYVKFCKFLIGVNKRAVNLAVKGELGRFPVEFHVCYRLLNTGITFNHRVTFYF